MNTATRKLSDAKGWKPLIEVSRVIPSARFLDGEDFGKIALEEYQGITKADYSGNRVLDVLSYQDGVLQGSNPFAVVLMNQILEQEDMHVARLSDLDRILSTGALDLRGYYEDAALVLRNTDEPNSYLAGNLQQQLKARGKVQYPALVSLADLELITDSESPYGLSFNLKEESKVIHAEQLDHKNNYKKFSETDNNGLPIFTKNSSRTLYTRDSGLSVLLLDGLLYLNSGWDGLDDSGSNGRVVAIRDAVADDDLEAEIESAYRAEIAELTSKKERARRIVRDMMQGKV